MTKYHYTLEELKAAVKQSFSTCQVLRRLNIPPNSGAMWAKIDKDIKINNIPWPHFVGNSKSGFLNRAEIPIEKYFNNEIPISSNRLKQKIFEQNLKLKQCECCSLSIWMNKPIPLHLHHINKNHLDNTFTNLQILCANCHGQEHAALKETRFVGPKVEDKTIIEAIKECYSIRQVLLKVGLFHAGGNYKRIKEIISNNQLQLLIKIKHPRVRKSRAVSLVSRPRINWPDRETLKLLVWEKPISVLCKDFGASSNALKKYCRKLLIEIPSYGYWQRRNAGLSHEEAMTPIVVYRKPLKRFSEEDVLNAKQLLDEGKSLREISEIIKFSHQVISHHLKSRGLYHGPQGGSARPHR